MIKSVRCSATRAGARLGQQSVFYARSTPPIGGFYIIENAVSYYNKKTGTDTKIPPVSVPYLYPLFLSLIPISILSAVLRSSDADSLHLPQIILIRLLQADVRGKLGAFGLEVSELALKVLQTADHT